MKVIKHLKREQEKSNSVRYEVVDSNVQVANVGKELLYIKKTDLNAMGFGSDGHWPDELEVTIEVSSS